MKSNERLLIILNPTAGKGKAGQHREEIEGLLRAAGANYDVKLTERVGHATELARAAGSEGYTVAVAGGGDGTVNEVINGLIQAGTEGKPVCELGVLPVGRGNDFSYGADIPSSLADSIAVLVGSYKRPLDVGLIKGGDYPEGKHFGNGIGVGFDTIVGLEAAKMRRVQGFMAYVFGALKTFIIYPLAPKVKVSFNGSTIEQKSHQISIMNGKRMGGTFFMAPQARNDDGQLDLCMAGELSRSSMISLMVHYTKGTQAQHPSIKIDRSQLYQISAPEGGLIVHADGETICTNGTALSVQCLPGKLTIRCQESPGG
jgi:YegS/Rv2252/BmrU family lipid kinase